MFTRKLVASLAAAVTLVTGAGVATASAQDDVPSLGDVQTVEEKTEVDAPESHTRVFSADVRINGHRVQEEWYFAFGVSEEWPGFASLWLLTDAEQDEWIPLCFGYYMADGDGSLFFGSSIHGDADEGCVMLGLGEEGDVFFTAVELEGDEVLTASMYALD